MPGASSSLFSCLVLSKDPVSQLLERKKTRLVLRVEPNSLKEIVIHDFVMRGGGKKEDMSLELLHQLKID